MVPKAGLEPARGEPRLILSQVRLPIPPLRHIVLDFTNIKNYIIFIIFVKFFCKIFPAGIKRQGFYYHIDFPSE